MARLRTNSRRTPHVPHTARRALALFCLVLGVAGCILPIIPGLPFLVITGRLLGPRDPLLRKGIVASRRALRRLRGARQPLLRRAGTHLTPHLHTFTRLIIGSRNS
jgi:hypothetical protein